MAKRRTARRITAPRKRAGMLPGEAKRQSLVTVERVARIGETGLMAPDHYIVTSHRLDGVWTHSVELAGQRMTLPGKVVDQIIRHRDSIVKEQKAIIFRERMLARSKALTQKAKDDQADAERAADLKGA